MIIERDRFLFAGPKGISMCQIPKEAWVAHNPDRIAFQVKAVWSRRFALRGTLLCPPMSPLDSEDPSKIEIAVACGGMLRRFTIDADNLAVVERHRLLVPNSIYPVYAGFSLGRGIGIFRLPDAPRAFTTFPLGRSGVLPPLLQNDTDFSAHSDGSIVCEFGPQETLAPGSMVIDERNGVAVFIVHTPSKAVARITILELVDC